MLENESKNKILDNIVGNLSNEDAKKIDFSNVAVDGPGDTLIVDEKSLGKFMGEKMIELWRKMKNSNKESVLKLIGGSLEYDMKKKTILSRGQSTQIEKFYKRGMKLKGLDLNLTYDEGIRLANFKNWIKYMQRVKWKNKKIICSYRGWHDVEDYNEESWINHCDELDEYGNIRDYEYTFYLRDYPSRWFPPMELVGIADLKKYCPICKRKNEIMKIADRLNN